MSDENPYEVDKGHVTDYVSPEGPKDLTPPGEVDKSHVKFYVSPVPEPEEEPEPDPAQLARQAHEKELRAHEELVRRMQEEDRKRAAKSVEPTSIEGQD